MSVYLCVSVCVCVSGPCGCMSGVCLLGCGYLSVAVYHNGGFTDMWMSHTESCNDILLGGGCSYVAICYNEACADMQALHNLTFTKMADLAGRLVYNRQDEIVFNFGKHRGKTVAEVLKKEPSYYDWMMKGDFTRDTKRKLTEIKLQSLSL